MKFSGAFKGLSVLGSLVTGTAARRCWQPTFARTLYTAEALGLDGYSYKRSQIQSQFAGLEEKFLGKMQEYAKGDAKNMIFTEDLKNMLHLLEDKPDQLTLIKEMMKKYNQQNKNLRFGTFTFGPVVMRTYYHLNKPAEALEVFKDKQLEGLFDQLSSAQILCDLLYNNGMYKDVLDVADIMRNKKIQGISFPRAVINLTLASCYKLNDAQGYEYGLKLLNDMKQAGVEVSRKGLGFVAALAVAQNAPQIALEIIAASNRNNYVTLRNLKIVALADMGRPDDALPVLRLSIELDNPTNAVKHTVCPDVLDKLTASVDSLGNKDIALEFERIAKALKEANLITDKKLSELLEQNIEKLKQDFRPNQFNNLQRQSIQNRFNRRDDYGGFGNSLDFKPRRNPAYERQRQSLSHDDY